MGFAATALVPSRPRPTPRDAHVLIKPDQQNSNNWTKVSIDILV